MKLTKMNHKVKTLKTPHTQTSPKNTNAIGKNEYRDFKEIYLWKED